MSNAMTSTYSQQNRNVFRTWLLFFAFFGLVSGLFYIMARVFNQPSLVFVGVGVSIFQSFLAYFFGGTMAIASAGGEEVLEENNRRYSKTENLHQPRPKPKCICLRTRSKECQYLLEPRIAGHIR
jgi:hypothetical protein